jgi:hypothetical protein
MIVPYTGTRGAGMIAPCMSFPSLSAAALALTGLTAANGAPLATNGIPDPRHLNNGSLIPTERYSDQPYIVRTDDGAWLCVLTTGRAEEGSAGQHVVSWRSRDQGRTWQDYAQVEPADGPEASYAVLLKTPGGRIYVFYNHNTDNLRTVHADNPPYRGGECPRVDSLGYFVFKFSDDHGRTWSARRFVIPVRETAIDRHNPYGGRVRFFWNVGRAFSTPSAAFVPLHKVGGFGEGFFTRTEGWLLRSENLLTERDPEKIRWETLPDGERGLTTPSGGGPISEEQSIVGLSDGTFYAVWRSIDGHPVCARSRDGGHTWTPPAYQTFADGRQMKHPRAANFIWRCANGRYLYWFHNHGGHGYEDRNPAWLCGGIEIDTPAGKTIAWGEPEIVLYDDDPFVRMSYPDLVEEGGRYYLTETQKATSRVHEVDPTLLEAMWGQFTNAAVAHAGLLCDWSAAAGRDAGPQALPPLPDFLVRDKARADYGTKDLRTGVTLELWLEVATMPAPGVVLASNRTPDGRGFMLTTAEHGAVELILGDGRVESRWASDAGALRTPGRHQLVAVIDGGPKIVTFIGDGRLHDGGTARQFGWGRFSAQLRGLNGAPALSLTTTGAVRVTHARVYGRALRTSEAVGSYRAGP